MKTEPAGSVPNRFFGLNLNDMDGKVILWIIGLVIYFYLQSRKRKAQASEEAPPEPTTTLPPVSFEDLLREIQASRNPQPSPKPAPPRQEPEFEYDFDYEDEKHREKQRDLEEEAMVNQAAPAVAEYEAAKTAAFNRASLEETMSLEQTDLTFGKFRVYDKEEKPAYVRELAREFQDRENLKKAFILKEILDRRF